MPSSPEGGHWVRQGRKAEEYVARWLWLRGHRILARNARCRGGGLDIVVRKGRRLIAIEVRSYIEGGEALSEWLRYGKRRSIWRSIRRFQELRRNALGHLEVHAFLPEVQFGRDGRIKTVTSTPSAHWHNGVSAGTFDRCFDLGALPNGIGAPPPAPHAATTLHLLRRAPRKTGAWELVVWMAEKGAIWEGGGHDS